MLVKPDGGAVPLHDRLRIGRADENELVLRDGRVSRSHARIVEADGGFAIEDLGSSNGTYLDGKPIRRARLLAGMKIVVGETVLEVR
jgi:pSer/pThr/pTyr-binding forkhead associated (FHA) protein